jgi:hypothetical protein
MTQLNVEKNPSDEEGKKGHSPSSKEPKLHRPCSFLKVSWDSFLYLGRYVRQIEPEEFPLLITVQWRLKRRGTQHVLTLKRTEAEIPSNFTLIRRVCFLVDHPSFTHRTPRNNAEI